MMAFLEIFSKVVTFAISERNVLGFLKKKKLGGDLGKKGSKKGEEP